MLIGLAVTLVIVLGAGTFVFIRQAMGSHAAGAVPNPDCSIIVPNNPLSAQGLATPYQLVATNPNNGPCNEATAVQAAFVQGAVFDPATNQISIYNPLVIDKGTKPVAAPVVPKLPANAVVGLWFGYNGANLTLKGAGNSLRAGKCVNGTNGSIFGQFAYCNAQTFFQATNRAVQAGKLVPPALGTAKDGQPCPTVRDFSVVDQDQSDNVTTAYLLTPKGPTQMTAANAALFQNAQTQINGSDNRLVSIALDGALGCTSWKAPDLADPGQMTTALPLNELQAAAHQAAPIALIPNLDPMVLINNQRNLNKLNVYRMGVDQFQVANAGQSKTTTYCTNLANIAPMRLALDAQFTQVRPSPDPAAANNLFNFLGQRFAATWTNLNCKQLTGKASPIAVQTDANGIAIKTMINGVNVIQPPAAVNCAVNGVVIANCTGTTTINGKTCTMAITANDTQVNITCPAQDKAQPPTPGQTTVQNQDPAQDQDPVDQAQPSDPTQNPQQHAVKNQ